MILPYFFFDNPWKRFKFNPNVFINIGKEGLEFKNKLINCYKSRGDKKYCNAELINAWARTRGGQVNLIFAEAFELNQIIM
jgi:hypothetical protein